MIESIDMLASQVVGNVLFCLAIAVHGLIVRMEEHRFKLSGLVAFAVATLAALVTVTVGADYIAGLGILFLGYLAVWNTPAFRTGTLISVVIMVGVQI